MVDFLRWCHLKDNDSIIRSSSAECLTYFANKGESSNNIKMHYENENIWMTQKMMATLFDVDVRTINYHVNKILTDNELEKSSVIQNFRITASFPSGSTSAMTISTPASFPMAFAVLL